VGKLLDLFKGRSPAGPPVRRAGGTMVDLTIVGESFHQNYIRQVNRRARGGEFEIVLRAEPNNPHDRNAVAVLVDGKPVGHLAKETAAKWQPEILAAEASGFVVAGTAQVFGGTQEKPSVGVFGAAPWPGVTTPQPRRRGK
jgi:hypothetical protein